MARKTEEAGGPHSLRAGERVVHFPGFNAFPLNATVLAGGAHPYFAVMVAGPGPTDRDWSNPLIPVPSHGGRDVAAWLQGQGIGSLRFDKRFIGSKDSKLDISLDAQVGDIRAAIKAAHLLPEATGKKILLIGHSEGALLSLLAAGEADAALLLAMPSLSMGKLIVAQVKGQLKAAGAPAEVSALNLAYLESVLGAIARTRNRPLRRPVWRLASRPWRAGLLGRRVEASYAISSIWIPGVWPNAYPFPAPWSGVTATSRRGSPRRCHWISRGW